MTDEQAAEALPSGGASRRYRKFTDEELRAMEEMAQTMSYGQIADEFGVTETSIAMTFKRKGLKRPDRVAKLKALSQDRIERLESQEAWTCAKCGEEKPPAEFHRGNRTTCGSCRTKAAIAWQQTDAGKATLRKAQLKMRYGMTVEEWDALLAFQGGVCAICKHDKPRAKNWATDHCHADGPVRGLLCLSCNNKLEWFIDHRETIIDYLENPPFKRLKDL